MTHDFDLKGVFTRFCLGLEDRADGGNADDDQDEQRDYGPRDLERGIAVDVFRLGLAGTLPELDQRQDEDRFDEDEDRGSGVDQQLEKMIDVPIDVRASMENRIGMAPAAGGHEDREGDRQRGRTRIAGTRPAQAGVKRHEKSFYRRTVAFERPRIIETLVANCD
jgi:hypothetical protein